MTFCDFPWLFDLNYSCLDPPTYAILWFIVCQNRLFAPSLRGQDSKWFGYLQSLPRETVDTAIFWGAKDVIDFRSCVCSSRGEPIPSHSAIGDDAGNVGPACSNTDFPECAPCLQYLDSKRARMWLSCTEAEKELDGLMVSTLSP